MVTRHQALLVLKDAGLIKGRLVQVCVGVDGGGGGHAWCISKGTNARVRNGLGG